MMKYRKWSIFAVLLLLIAALSLSVHASEYAFVHDEVGLLDVYQVAHLDEMATDISERYDCGVYIVTMWDYTQYGSTVRDAAENYFLANGFGISDDDNGVLLLLSMTGRDYALIAHGSIGNAAFTDYGKDVLSETFLDDFQYDDWPGGLEGYVEKCDDLLYAASIGTPVDVEEESSLGFAIVMSLLISAVIAGIACGIMAISMKTARISTHADDYSQNVQITGRHDQFITRTVVRQKIETSSSSSGGTKVNSRGFSGKSGKF